MRSGRGWSPLVILLIVFGVFLVSELVVLAVLGSEAAAAPTVSQNCQINVWFVHFDCSEVSTQNPNAFQAQQLAQFLGPVFAVIDAVFIVAVALVVLSSSKGSRTSGRQIGNGGRR